MRAGSIRVLWGVKKSVQRGSKGSFAALMPNPGTSAPLK
jgi:hypothetical protein